MASDRPTILIVDDEEPLLLLVTITLQTEPYRVVVARDGEEALALARAERPDFVLLDVGLPKIDGLEVCRRLRADPQTRGMTIVMLSARAAEEDRAAGLAAGADDYLTKPFRPREFVTYLAGRMGPSSGMADPVIDCDVHVDVPNVDALFPCRPYWVEHVRQTVFRGPTDYPYPRNAPVTFRPGSKPEADATTGQRLDMLRQQLLDPGGVEVAVLQCSYGIEGLHNPDAAVAFAAATNDFLIAEYLEREPRLRAAMVVPSQLPQLAAREIERVGDHPGFVQVYLPVRSQHPYGSRLFHPLWEAIDRKGLVAGLHFGGAPGNPPFPSGWPSYYIEDYAGMAQVFQHSQVVSIVSEGVFDLFPNVRVALVEAGFTWMPAFMWRFDKEWRNLRRLVPWVKQSPTAYLRQHVRLTIQPIDAPPTPQQMLQVLDQIGSEKMLLYASDYPHSHTFDPERSLLPDLPPDLARKIRSENARALYRLGA